jgi:hypothetical protein
MLIMLILKLIWSENKYKEREGVYIYIRGGRELSFQHSCR